MERKIGDQDPSFEAAVKEVATDIRLKYSTGDNYLTSIKLYVNPETLKTEMCVGYENHERVKDSGTEDTTPSLLESRIDWPESEKADDFETQFTRAKSLAKELRTMLIIKCDKATGYTIEGKVYSEGLDPRIKIYVDGIEKKESNPTGEKCPSCGSLNLNVYEVRDKAFSIHYIDDEADFGCNDCGNKWTGQYGYKGLA